MTRLLYAVTILVLLSVAACAQYEEYIHLPGKSCEDAPPCPDGRPCVMAPPHCNAGTCGTDPVPTCARQP